MDLSQYHEKYVRIKDIYGEVHEGLACHGGADFLMAEYGGEEDGLFIEDFLIYESQIETIEEYVPHGTAETAEIPVGRCKGYVLVFWQGAVHV